jgi:transposase-like protein
MRKTKKHKQFSIEEKNKIVLLYLDRHMRTADIIRTYGVSHKRQLYVWVNQYKEFGTCVDRRGKATKKEAPTKGRPKKYKVNLDELSKEQLIEKVRMYEDIKKSIAYLIKEQRN